MKMFSQYQIENGVNMISIWTQKGKRISDITVLKEIEPGVYKKQ